MPSASPSVTVNMADISASFDVGNFNSIFDNDNVFSDEFDEAELLALDELMASSMPENYEMKGLTEPEDDALPSISRFKHITEEEMCQMETNHQSTSTKMNTKWGVKLFQGKWNVKNNYYLKQLKLQPRQGLEPWSINVHWSLCRWAIQACCCYRLFKNCKQNKN